MDDSLERPDEQGKSTMEHAYPARRNPCPITLKCFSSGKHSRNPANGKGWKEVHHFTKPTRHSIRFKIVNHPLWAK